MAGAETLSGAPVSEIVQTSDSLASLDQAIADNPTADNREELLELRDYLSEQADAQSQMHPDAHISSNGFDRRQERDPKPRALKAVYDEDGNLLSVEAADGMRGFMVPSQPPNPFDWKSRSRDSWRFTQPRRYQLGRHVKPGSTERLMPHFGHGVPNAESINQSGGRPVGGGSP